MNISLQNNLNVGEANALSKRLYAIASMVFKGASLADVGSDHARLAVYLLKNNICTQVICSDINPLPLLRAERAVADSGFSPCAHFVLTDGIRELIPFSPDIFVIAGMGGDTISGILSNAGEIPQGTLFLLQPMSKKEKLRRYLYENGFLIREEKIVCENKKVFVIISAQYDGIVRNADDFECLVGQYNIDNRDENVQMYFNEIKTMLEKKISGKAAAGLDFSADKNMHDRLCGVLTKQI